MVQYEIDDGSIRVLYGSDESIGVFLTVIDRRLEWKQQASEEANKVVNKILKDKSGHYLRLTTGKYGNGEKVSRAAMADFMGRYGVPKMRIDELLGFYNPCMECKKATKLRCSKCKWKFYCSKECQLANKERHNHLCDIKVPEKRVMETESQKSVYGVLLMPENEAKPKFVEITLDLEYVEVFGFGDLLWELQMDEYFQGEYSITPREWGRDFKVRTGNNNLMFDGDVREHRPTHMENMLHFYYGKNYMNDGSKLNECVRKITGGMATHHWAGPILVLKAQKNPSRYDEDEYIDMKLEDSDDMVDFFMLFGK